jgi:alpha-L-fucosidase 2
MRDGFQTVVFDAPAANWEEALPLGNGRLGALVFGSPDREKIQLNEESVWSGPYRDRNNPAAKDALPVIRRLLNEGRVKEAEDICLECFSGIPAAGRVYQTAGELLISFSPDGGFGFHGSGTRSSPLLSEISNYRRELDIRRALHTLSFKYDGAAYKRECFISAPADVFVMRFSASFADGSPATGKISFRASLGRGVFLDRQGNTKDGAFIACDGNIPFYAMTKIICKNGKLNNRGGFVTVENADEALLLVDIRTAFRERDYETACISSLDGIAARGGSVTEIWERLLEEHVNEYLSWYGRLKLELPGNAETVLYYNFCRYLLVSSSRPGTLPSNLQGIWNPYMDPPWGSDYTININTQMNYWPACMCNLAETEEPLFDLIERMYPKGKKTAEIMYGCRGFAAHHNTDLWGDTAPRDYWLPGSYWPLGAAWLTLHIWEHYEYTLDKKFLEKYFYLLKEACVFFADFLIPEKKMKGDIKDSAERLIVSPSVSPENSFLVNGEASSLCAGCEMDDQILRKLFQSAVRAFEILDVQDADTALFCSILERIPLPKVDSNGTIREWNEEYEEAEPGHRHFSHLWALWPGDSIAPDETPELAETARKSIERRLASSGGHTGWSRAWLVNFMASLRDGDAAMENLQELFDHFTLPNLFNNGPPFQIDGNFGALSGITRMLFQSRIRYDNSCAAGFRVILDLLPAIPRDWPEGRMKGARAKGNLELDIDWQDGHLRSLVIRNKGAQDISVTIRATSFIRELLLPHGETSSVFL